MSIVGMASASGSLRSLVLVAIHDLTQKRHAILRNFPIIGHFRYWLEAVGPELRQYIVTGNDEERPFSRDQRRWVYASSKKENNYFGFGTDNDLERSRLHPHPPQRVPDPHAARRRARLRSRRTRCPACAVLGGCRGRKHAFRPTSIVNTSAMSYGSLSQRGGRGDQPRRRARAARCRTPAKAASRDYHRKGGDIIWQIGTGYFGCRDDDGRFSTGPRRSRAIASAKVRAIEIKLSQGAKPGLGGVLPAAKITPEIAQIRGIPLGRDCISPASHTAFSDVVEHARLHREARRRDRPARRHQVARSATSAFWRDLAAQIDTTKPRRPTSSRSTAAKAAPARRRSCSPITSRCRSSSASPRSTATFAEAGAHHKVVFIGSGKLGFPETGAARARARLRHDQRRARGDARRSAASRRSAATPATARPASRRRTRG